MSSNKKNYFIIVLYGLILTAILLGTNHLYGSNIDWLTQHTVIPEYFRNLFYETGKFIPNLAFHLGAGQNIFHYSYYGLLSPIILLSYFFPFVSMTSYIMVASILLYLLSGVLFYRFLVDKIASHKLALFVSIAFLTLSPLTYHFHHHIMFVWYIPFLLLSLMGVDKYVDYNKSWLFMLGVFLVIMTNYYYSVPSILAVVVYGVYKLLSKKTFSFKGFIFACLKACIRIIIPILSAGILLFPTAYVIFHTGRNSLTTIPFASFFTISLEEIVYTSFSMGLTFLLLLSPIGLLLQKKKAKNEIFLSIVLLVVSFVPFIMYLLNGMLYIRGKVFIPFLPLYLFSFLKFIEALRRDKITYRYLFLAMFLVFLLLIFMNRRSSITLFFFLDFFITFLSIYFFKKHKNIKLILLPVFLIVLVSTCVNNYYETYVSIEQYRKNNNYEDLMKDINEDGVYRVDNNVTYDKFNKNYGVNYNNTTIYSSSYNPLYWNFYQFSFGNNIKYRNLFITGGTDNVLFHDLMGVKYVVSNKTNIGYEKIKSSHGKNLYLNKFAYPVVYTTNSIGSKKQYDQLKFPYNMEYLMHYPVVEDGNAIAYQTNIKKEDWNLLEQYQFELKKDTTYTYPLKDSIKDKVIILSFSMNHNDICDKEEDKMITINGISNKLTCSDWLYYNKNKRFEYVISSNEEINDLKIKFSKGKYNISDIHIYTMDYKIPTFLELYGLKYDSSNSTFTGISNLEKDGYLITSIPYDDGFEIFVDGKKIKKEIVNQAFLGAKLTKGKHKISIKYTSPWYYLGIISSILGMILFLLEVIYEKHSEKIKALLKKYKEILFYILFGVLTTFVSLAVYYLCILTVFNPENGIQLQLANLVSWFISVLFAYLTNRKYVFASKNKNYFSEIVKFYGSRICTLLLDMLLMGIFVSLLHFNDKIVKLFVQIVVIILNYIFSKIIVFRGVNNGKN